ncbi:hypothetical protein KGF56_002155 [Candida oxycetoniae]|uniref:Uncharacterized protein n=1 Tax=Candida oxycetoniae TaxID=497107 RepID=A0AAI9SYG4_9ASCO|nr:uncharacterized protein KGF56_002155 [Candida oxycetoniae]KAI3405070.2 hypothetical protein KGF56_002155 [Candida oxycetoniae]
MAVVDQEDTSYHRSTFHSIFVQDNTNNNHHHHHHNNNNNKNNNNNAKGNVDSARSIFEEPDITLVTQCSKQSSIPIPYIPQLSRGRLNLKKSFTAGSTKLKTRSHPLVNDEIDLCGEEEKEEEEEDVDDDDDDEFLDEYESDDLSFSSTSSFQSSVTNVSRKPPPLYQYHSFNNALYSYVSPKSTLMISIPTNRSISIASSSVSSVNTCFSPKQPTQQELPPLQQQQQQQQQHQQQHHPHHQAKVMSRSLSGSSTLSVTLPQQSPQTTSCSPVTITSKGILGSDSSSNASRFGYPKKTLRHASSTECLYKLLHNSSSPSVKKLLYSNLTTSLKLLKNKIPFYTSRQSILNNIISEPPRLTDDKFPTSQSEELITFFQDDQVTNDHEMSAASAQLSFTPHIKSTFKNRDSRINSQFLRLYAYDYNARINSQTLPNSLAQDDSSPILTKKSNLTFHIKHNMFRISNMSREKLWNSVILPPRKDQSPMDCIDSESYCPDVEMEEEDEKEQKKNNTTSSAYGATSITRKSGKYLPWDLKPSIKPAGVLHGGKWVFNGMAPNSGITKTQFTVKGWCNSKWRNIYKEFDNDNNNDDDDDDDDEEEEEEEEEEEGWI